MQYIAIAGVTTFLKRVTRASDDQQRCVRDMQKYRNYNNKIFLGINNDTHNAKIQILLFIQKRVN